MALDFLYWVGGILGLVSLFGLGLVIRDRIKNDEDPADGREIENYMIQYTGGNSEGIVDKIELGNDRIRIEAYYFDKRKLQKDRRYRPQKFTTFHEKRQVVPLFYGNEDKIKAFPHRIDLLPSGILNTDYGKQIARVIQENNQLEDESKLMNMRLDNLNKISKQTVGGEIFTDFVKKSREINKDIKESILREEIKKTDDKKK